MDAEELSFEDVETGGLIAVVQLRRRTQAWLRAILKRHKLRRLELELEP